MTTYATIISGPAAVLRPDVTARTYASTEEDGIESVFNYTETASDLAGVGALTERLTTEKVLIIGLGGTGSYILDLVAKTPVPEVRLSSGRPSRMRRATRSSICRANS
jgi:hypothetical protein